MDTAARIFYFLNYKKYHANHYSLKKNGVTELVFSSLYACVFGHVLCTTCDVTQFNATRYIFDKQITELG